MKSLLMLLVILQTASAWAADAIVDVKLSPAGSFQMKTSQVNGQAVKSGDTVSAENIVVKLDTLKGEIALRDKHAKEKYLETKKYPDAVLIKATGQGGQGKGRIKIRGVERDIEGTYTLSGKMLNATFPLKVSEFGITGIKYMGVGVKDEIKISVSVPVVEKK